MNEIVKQIGKHLAKLFGKQAAKAATNKMNKIMSNKQIDYNTSFELELRTPVYSFYAGIFFILLGLGGTYLVVNEIINGAELNGDLWAGIAVIALVLVGAIFLTIDNKTKYVKLSNSFVNSHSVFVKDQELRWTEVDSVKFKEKQYMELYKGKDKVRIYYAYVGSKVALRIMHDKLDLGVYIEQLVQNEHYYRAFLECLTEAEIQAFVDEINRRYRA